MKTKANTGMRVRIKSIDRKGEIFFIDWPHYNLPHMHPIQVKLDKPMDGCIFYRSHQRDLAKLKPKSTVKGMKKKRAPVKKAKKKEPVFDFS